MRELFDQYRDPENRLTHALVCCLAEDRKLMSAFLRWAGVALTGSGALRVTEQQLPGEPEGDNDEAEAERRGLPDGWIYTDDGWALLIESKVASKIHHEQLNRHLRTATRRGFNNVHVLVLCVGAEVDKLPARCIVRRWRDLYAWGAGLARKHPWADKLIRYMQVAERRMVDETYLREGVLTTFSGIAFDQDNPYSYMEAKRLLKLLMQALRTDKSLAQEIGADLRAPGRPAITGSQQTSVWDFIPLTAPREAHTPMRFTHRPHLTLSIEPERVSAVLTIPNGLDGALRRRLFEGGYKGFKGTLSKFVASTEAVTRTDPGARPIVIVQQRRYPSQRSIPTHDARLEFDPRTAFRGTKGIKEQEQWLRATYDAMEHRRSNIELGIGLRFPYRESKKVNTKDFPRSVAAAWKATKPLIRLMLPEYRFRRTS